MKNKLKILGILMISIVVVLILFITIVGIGNYFQGIGQDWIGNLFMGLFPVVIYLAVKLFNKKVNGLRSVDYGFGFKNFLFSSFLGAGLAIVMGFLVLLITKFFFDIDIELSGFKNDFQKPLLSLIITLIIVGVWEEFYFRGLIFNTLLKSKFGFHLSAFISSVMFSIIHWSSFDMSETSWLWYIGIVVSGYIFVYIYTITNSIWSVVSYHFVWNVYATLLDDLENKIGLFEITNYLEHSKTIDNITVVCLSILLLVILVLDKTKPGLIKIDAYINRVASAKETKDNNFFSN